LAQELPRDHECHGGSGTVRPLLLLVAIGAPVEPAARAKLDGPFAREVDAALFGIIRPSSQVRRSAVAFGFSETRAVSAKVAALKSRQPVLSPQSWLGSSHCLRTSAIFCTPNDPGCGTSS